MKRFAALATTCAFGWMLACGGQGPEPPKPSRAAPVGAPRNAAPVATYKGGAITHEDVSRELSRLPPALRETFGSTAGQRELARSLIDKRLLAAEARKRGLSDDPGIRRQVADLEERLIVQALMAAEEKARGAATETELRAYFDSHKAELEQPERVRASRVLAALPANASTGEKAKGRARAGKWLARARKGEELAKLASEGDGPERARGGDLGFLAKGQIDDPALATAAFQAAELGKPTLVECRDGFAVLMVTEKREKRLPSFEEVRGEVEGRVAPARKRKVFDDLLERLRTEADTKIVGVKTP